MTDDVRDDDRRGHDFWVAPERQPPLIDYSKPDNSAVAKQALDGPPAPVAVKLQDDLDQYPSRKITPPEPDLGLGPCPFRDCDKTSLHLHSDSELDAPIASQLQKDLDDRVFGRSILKTDPTPEPDDINHPSHYNVVKIEDFIEETNLNFRLGNAVKHISRSAYKGRQIEDLEEAVGYLNREIQTLKFLGK